jgi:2-dehydro-3-deoxy-D-arabinonate dehydratase
VRIVQFNLGSAGRRVGLIEGGDVVDITNPAGGLRSALDLVEWADERETSLTAAVDHLRGRDGESYSLTSLDVEPGESLSYLDLPLAPPEVWGCGVTYRKSAEFRDEETSSGRGIYDYVYSGARPEIFFKATASRCVGPRGRISIRSDSLFTAPEPELAIVVDSRGGILGYTVADDVSAWDIERENPLYLPQSKVFAGCCAIGPAIVTPDDVPDPYDLTVIGRISRGDSVIFDDRISTSRIRRRLDELVGYLLRDNPVPAGTVILTGTGVIVSAEHALIDGDIVEVEIPGLGKIRNRAMKLMA